MKSWWGALSVKNEQVVFNDHEITVISESGDQIPLWSLSSGEKQLLLILVEVVNAGRAPVLIDEPELSMHIDWQRQLLETLELVNSEAQVIVATHSPEIMAEIPDDRIHRV